MLFNPVDLRGIPTANADKTLAIWLRPQIFHMDESEDTVNILFLDEISAALPSVQAAAYQITLDRMIGEHKLPDNCIVIAAGNRVTDKSVAYNMPKALANRLCHFEIKGDSVSWHNWAIKNGVHPYVVGYLEFNPVAMMKQDVTEIGLAFPTPRSWEMVSNILCLISSDVNSVYPMISGCIGIQTAALFREWTEVYISLPKMEDIFGGNHVSAPKEPELLIALRAMMAFYAGKHPDKTLINNSINFACDLPWTFRKQLLHDYFCIPILRPILRENDVFKTAVENGLK